MEDWIIDEDGDWAVFDSSLNFVGYAFEINGVLRDAEDPLDDIIARHDVAEDDGNSLVEDDGVCRRLDRQFR